jgi:hypothetical protein
MPTHAPMPLLTPRTTARLHAHHHRFGTCAHACTRACARMPVVQVQPLAALSSREHIRTGQPRCFERAIMCNLVRARAWTRGGGRGAAIAAAATGGCLAPRSAAACLGARLMHSTIVAVAAQTTLRLLLTPSGSPVLSLGWTCKLHVPLSSVRGPPGGPLQPTSAPPLDSAEA